MSHANIEVKIRHLMMVLSVLPDIEIVCTDLSECFDDNKAYLTARLEAENNGRMKKLVKKMITVDPVSGKVESFDNKCNIDGEINTGVEDNCGFGIRLM